MQYTETIEVQAESYQEAVEVAQEQDGVRNHDDTVINMYLLDMKE